MPSFTTVALAAAALTATASAQKQIFRADDVLVRPYDSISPGVVLIHSRQEEQQTPTTAGNATEESLSLLNPDGSLNMTAWNEATDEACRQVLGKLSRASSPSGTSCCYNLLTLDAAAGTFEADLRLYRVSEPREEWTNINDIDVMVGYVNAEVDNVTEEEVQGVGMLGASSVSGLLRRQQQDQAGDSAANVTGDGPTPMQAYKLVGQINTDQLRANMTMAELEALAMPILTLRAAPTPGRADPMNTTVNSNEAAFLTGVFSNKVVLSDFSAAQAAVDKQMERLRNKEIAFVVPGTRILLFPIGLVITGIWALVGFAVYGFGTWERLKYRQMYQERQQLLVKAGR